MSRPIPDPLDYVRNSYGVPAAKDGRVRYTGGKEPRDGTITGAQGGHVMIRLDGEKNANPYHPTWELEYLSNPVGGCINHPDRPVRTNLDGDDLCQECADAWARGEGDHAAYLDREGLDHG